MADYIINAANSISTTNATGLEGNAGPDLFLINAGGSVSTTSDGFRAAISASSEDQVIVNGTVSYSLTSNPQFYSAAIAGSVTNIVINSSGVVNASGTGAMAVYMEGSGNTLVNDGSIVSSGIAVRQNLNQNTTTKTVTNSGTISSGSGVAFEGAWLGIDTNFTNTGVVNGRMQGVFRETHIVNSGTLGDISADFYGDFHLDSSGGSIGAVNVTTKAAFENALLLGSTLSLSNTHVRGGLTMTNDGSTSGFTAAIHAGTSIEGSLVLQDDLSDIVRMDGGSVVGTVATAGGEDLISIAGGTVLAISAGDGADNVSTQGGLVAGTTSLGEGDDIFQGGSFVDKVTDGTGADNVGLGGGNDQFLASATNDNDTVDGGAGIDTYDASLSTDPVLIDLANRLASGASIGFDQIASFENAVGSSVADTLLGSSLTNVMRGGDGGDLINGLGGDDRLFGDAGADTINGGAGRDAMYGGAGADRFVYLAASESTVAGYCRDTIFDFTHAVDKIDLSAIDASTKVKGNQAFAWTGFSAFTGIAGQLHAALVNGNTVVSGDLNGDKVADFAITLVGSLPNVSAVDFVL